MTFAEYAAHDASSLAALVARKEMSAQELAELALRACGALGAQLGAVVERYDDVLDTLARSTPSGPFAGVPFLLKDVGATQAGRAQLCGSRLLRGRVVRETSDLTGRFQALGLTIVGRSASPEFALSLSTESLLYGDTRNPWNPSRLAGGSSGGAAAAVAAGLVPIAHATDTAGSIRIPASACGLVGLKPSRGRLVGNAAGPTPLGAMDTEFIVSRSLRDSAALFAALDAQGKEADAMGGLSTPLPVPLKVAVTTTPWGGYPIDPEIEAGVWEVARDLEALGHHVEQASPRFDYDHFVETVVVGWAAGFDTQLEAYAAAFGRPLDDTTLEAVTLALYIYAKTLTPEKLARAVRDGAGLCRSVEPFFRRYDLLVTPTLIRQPEPLGVYNQNQPGIDFETFFRHCDRSGVFLPLFNLTGQPALSLPLLWSREGLPVGVQFVARAGEEGTLLRLADALSALRPWGMRQPQLHLSRVDLLAPPLGEGRA